MRRRIDVAHEKQAAARECAVAPTLVTHQYGFRKERRYPFRSLEEIRSLERRREESAASLHSAVCAGAAAGSRDR